MNKTYQEQEGQPAQPGSLLQTKLHPLQLSQSSSLKKTGMVLSKVDIGFLPPGQSFLQVEN